MGYFYKPKAAVAAMTGDKPRPQLSLDELLLRLQEHGEVRLISTKPGDRLEGWRCCCDLYTAAKGLSASIISEWKHATGRDAAADCLERVIEAKLAMGGGS